MEPSCELGHPLFFKLWILAGLHKRCPCLSHCLCSPITFSILQSEVGKLLVLRWLHRDSRQAAGRERGERKVNNDMGNSRLIHTQILSQMFAWVNQAVAASPPDCNPWGCHSPARCWTQLALTHPLPMGMLQGGGRRWVPFKYLFCLRGCLFWYLWVSVFALGLSLGSSPRILHYPAGW